MIRVRSARDRGRGQTDWLESRFSFSFADYYDPKHVGFRALRVINEDRVAPARGFGVHSHRDMEILTYPVAGVLEHRDSQGHVSRLAPGYQERDLVTDVGLQPLVTPDGRDGSLRIHQDASVHRLRLAPHDEFEHPVEPARHAWLQIVRGDATLNGALLTAGDGVAVSNESVLRLAARNETEALLFDLV
jgi:redox-sensitive bicupin YhaK (pirin superfamily)